MKDPAKLLDKIIKLIDKDIKEIKRLSDTGKIPHEDALDLTRYSNALLSIIESKEEQKKLQKEKLSKLSSQELRELALKALNKNANPTPAPNKEPT